MTLRTVAAAAIAAVVSLAACGAPAPHTAATAAKPPPTGLSGVVLDEKGAPVAHARVSCWVPGPDGAQAAALTDDHGRFAFDLAPGLYLLRADVTGSDAGPIKVTVDPGRRLDGVTLQLPPVMFESGGNYF